MKRQINPMVDIVFKAIFGAEERKPVLMDFLNCIFTRLELPKITELTIQNPYSGRERLAEKEIILDVKVKDETGRYIQIEMQSDPYSHITKRMVYNNATITYKTLKKGENYNNVGEVISIWVLGKNLDNLQEGLDLVELKSRLGRKNFDLQKIIILESEKLCREDDRVGHWMYIINRWEDYNLDNPPEWMVEDKLFREVLKVMDVIDMNDEEFDYYLSRLNYQMDVSLREQSGFEKGLEQGEHNGQIQILMHLLNTKFQYSTGDPAGIAQKANGMNIKELSETLLKTETLNEFIQFLENKK